MSSTSNPHVSSWTDSSLGKSLSTACSVLLLCLSGCAGSPGVWRFPQSAFAETASALDRGKVAITAVGGGSAFISGNGADGGGGLRVRVGVGAHQEIGVEGGASAAQNNVQDCGGGAICDGENQIRTTVNTVNYTGRLSWKMQVQRHLAIIAGFGGAFSDRTGGDDNPAGYYRGYSLAGDLALLGSWELGQGPVSIYTGARVGLGGPLSTSSNPSFPDGLVVNANAPVGLSLRFAERFRFTVEIGPMLSHYKSTALDGDAGLYETTVGVSAMTGLGVVF